MNHKENLREKKGVHQQFIQLSQWSLWRGGKTDLKTRLVGFAGESNMGSEEKKEKKRTNVLCLRAEQLGKYGVGDKLKK